MKIRIGIDEQSQYKNVLDMIHDQYGNTNASCGGNGTCGKCKVIALEKNTQPMTSAELEHLTEKEIEQNVRLACMLRPIENMVIDLGLLPMNQDYVIESQFKINKEKASKLEQDNQGFKTYKIAVDVGTTTIVVALIDCDTEKVVGIEKTLNSQARYGVDVISRIQKSQEVGIQKLEYAVKEDILKCIHKLLDENSINLSLVQVIAIAGNTTMLHFLMGLNPLSLAVSPFIPTTTEKCDFSYGDFFKILPGIKQKGNCRVEILPSLSAYIGADVLTGIYNSQIYEKEPVSMLIDIGTNGELIIGNKQKIICTSTAAGPAFEGGNIINGIGSIEGAICKVEISEKKVKSYTLNDKKPKGLCGTGIIDTISEMLKENLLTEEGMMDSSLEGKMMIEEKSGIAIYQKDIQEIQLAKSAIRAGVEVLIKLYGIDYNAIDKVYLAGGFGSHMSIRNIIRIGLLPQEFENKIEVIGNSSLGGTIEYLLNQTADLEKIKGMCSYVDLANVSEFNDLFIENLDF